MKFWEKFSDLHIYDSKAEALFKAVIISITWLGVTTPNEDINEITNTFYISIYLFSLALVMEYTIKLITAPNFLSKILPLGLMAVNVFSVIASTAFIIERPIECVEYMHLFRGTKISLGIIWFDVLAMLIIERPPAEKLENNLGKYN